MSESNFPNFVSTASKLSKNPLSIIALLLVLVYGIAGFVASSNSFKENERYILVCFLAVFPVVILFLLYKLVTKHHDKLYAPSDFTEESNFVRLLEMRINKLDERVVEAGNELDSQIEELTRKLKYENLMHSAKNCMLDRNFEIAIDFLKKAFEFESTSQCWTQIAYCQKRTSKFSDALDSINRAIEIGGDDNMIAGMLFWNRACYAALSECNLPEIIDDIKRAVKLNPSLRGRIKTEPDLEVIHDTEEYLSLLKHYGYFVGNQKAVGEKLEAEKLN